MMEYTSGKVLAQTMDNARNLTRFYAGKLKGEDMHRQFELDGYLTNSPFWILAHLCWAEHMLLIECLGFPSMNIPWLNTFRIGSGKEYRKEDWPSLEEVFQTLKDIHATALEGLSNMTDEELDTDNALGVTFGDEKSKRFMAMHGIRHEGTHGGQLSLIVKMYGKTTV